MPDLGDGVEDGEMRGVSGYCPAMGPTADIWKCNQAKVEARGWPLVGKNAPKRSAWCWRIAPLSKTTIGSPPSESTSAGILPLGLSFRNSGVFWAPSSGTGRKV